MSDYGKGSRRRPEDWRKVHRNWPFGKRSNSRGVSTVALMKKLRSIPADVLKTKVIDLCGYPAVVRRTKAGAYRY